MSIQADTERRQKRGWARPGGSHDKLVRTLKIVLPALIGVVLAFLFFAPLEEKQEVSFVLDKHKVETAEERLRLTQVTYRGQDDEGRPFVLSARSGVRQTSASQIVDIQDMNAQIQLEGGPARLEAGRAQYQMERNHVNVLGPITFTAADGYRIQTRDVNVDLGARTMRSRGRVEGRMPLGTFTAGGLQVDLPNRTVVLTGRARLHIVQGGLR
ncbi:MAG TPA: LPS export ABC transporter periplasmic protein LptC [Allosphingosinicella sp.]|nr:LPS export ABC transporter periplasmic protein LptC [Allosphingosinicella sp.]